MSDETDSGAYREALTVEDPAPYGNYWLVLKRQPVGRRTVVRQSELMRSMIIS